MDNHKSSHSSASGDSPASSDASARTTTTVAAAAAATSSDKDQFLRHLNKLSHKISKPSSSSIGRPPPDSSIHLRPPAPPPAAVPPLQQQPPVYNINKSDFRDVVQKLTGSPAHAPPPIHAPKPPSSRLQRIRPPPLVQLSNRPPPMLNCAVPPPNPSGGGGFIRQVAPPLSPLPPLPTCHAAAESPISAYMRFLRGSISAVDSNNRMGLNPLQMIPPPESFAAPPPPSSPLPFGCLPSPTGAGPLGFPQLPLSPTVPGVPSPK